MIGVREPQPAASEAFVKFADAHRSIEKFGIRLLKTIKPVGQRRPWPCVRVEGQESRSWSLPRLTSRWSVALVPTESARPAWSACSVKGTGAPSGACGPDVLSP